MTPPCFPRQLLARPAASAPSPATKDTIYRMERGRYGDSRHSLRALDGSGLGRLWRYSIASALGQYRSALPFENEFLLPYHPSRYHSASALFLTNGTWKSRLFRSPRRCPRNRGTWPYVRQGEQMTERGALAGLRVLDLTDLKGHLCARLLADMGADVIKVEPPAGDSARRIGPFVDERPQRDRSLFFWFYNLNKRSLTLDLEHPEGAAVLRRLAEGADVVVESFKPGAMARMGLGWEILHALNPALVLCSIAPFGQSGQYRDYQADDSVLTALSGMIYVNGFADGAPVRPLGLQAYHSASYYAAVATMCSLFG